MYNVKDDSKNLIVSFEEASLSTATVEHMEAFLKEMMPYKKIAIDLANIKSLKNEFFDMLKVLSLNKKISLFNISAEMNLLLFIMNYNQYTRLYSNENDFKEGKRELVKRNFKFCLN